MAGLKIDLDRDILYEVPPARRPRGGVVIRRDPETGADVFMYRTEPGVYYSSNGLEVSATMAKRAGFDTEILAKEKEKLAKMAAFQANWEKDNESRDRKVVAERGEFRLVFMYGAGYYVEHKDGTIMTAHKRAPTEQMGLDWLTDFAGPEVKPDDNVSNTDGQGVGRTDRRAGQDGDQSSVVRQSGNKKVAVSA